MTINIYVINQELRLATPFKSLIDGTQEFIKFKFILDDAWLKITTFAQFVQDNIAYNVYLDENNCVYLPSEINTGTFTLMLYGTGDSTIGTSNYLTIKMDDNILVENAQSTQITQSLYSQLVNIVDGVNDNINTITTARASDVGKYLKVKSVNNGKVSAWEFDEGGSSEGGGGSGQDGQDGYSPTITVTNITGGHRVSITDVNGTKTFNVMNGTNGTNGTNGVSPTVSVTNIINGHRVSITDATGTNTFDVMDGSGSGDGGSSEVIYINVVPEQTFTPTSDNTRLTFTDLITTEETYRYIINGVETTGEATEASGSILLGNVNDYTQGTGAMFECVGGNVYFDTKLRTEFTVQVDKVVESSGEATNINPLYGKTAAFTGDSLCYGANYTGGYAKIIGEENMMTVQNIGVSEGTVVSYRDRFCISESIDELRSDADFVILEGGVNDAWYGTQVIPLGTLSSGYNATLDKTTFAGAFEYMLKTALERFPTAKIGYVFPHRVRDEFSAPNGAYYLMAKSALEKWGIPYLDGSTLIPPLGYIDTLSIYVDSSGHPSEAGYRLFYVPKITAFMQELLGVNGAGGSGSSVIVDNTLTISGTAADSKTVGDRLSNKVDVVSGKSLSTNDYTNLDKQKLDSISISSPTDGQVLAYNSTTQKWVNKTISNGSGDDSGQSGNVFIGNTPLTISKDTNVQLVASSSTEYSYGAPIVTDFANREGERLTNAVITEGDGYYEVEATEDATVYYESYVRIYLNNLTVGKEYAVNIYPQVNAGEEITGGTCAIYNSAGSPIKVINTVDAPVTDTFVATETSMRLRVLPAGAYFWERGYRKARFTNIIVAPVLDELVASDFSKRENVALTNVTLTEEDGYYEIAATEDATSYTNAYADMSFSGLTTGKDYIINVVPNGSSSESASGGLYQFMTFDGDTIGELILLNEAGQLEFTATSNTIRLRLYVASGYLWNNGYTKGRLSSLTITEKTSGTFTGTLNLGVLPVGTEIRSTPSCEVYEVKEEEKEEQQKTRHTGKICVCFGDSVTGFMTPPNDYPSIIAKETGMTVYNVGYAGCRMSDTHPYPAYRVFGMTHLADAITSGDWTDQDSYVDQIEDLTFPREHLANLKSINWNNVDFITIFYGGNDAGNGVPLGDPTGENIETFLGAFNYSIKKILTTYPLIKILVLTPIFRYWVDEEKDSDEYDIPEYGTENTRKYYEWGDALIERAKAYKLPAVDMYRTLGINSITRTSYLKNDGAHPREEGNKLIGGKIAAKLLSEY